MKLIKIGTIAFLSVLAISCTKEEEKPKVIYPNENDSVGLQKIDSTEIKIADLPIHLSSTDYLLHPVGDVRVYNSGNSRYGSSKTKEYSYAISGYNYPEITGYLTNLLFQHKDSLDIRPLTENRMQIQSITYLDELAIRSSKEILIYAIVDIDTNRDGKYDSNDIKSLYISHINGRDFVKLTEDLHELLDWKYIDANQRLYFRSVEDINKNGAFDNTDKVHYFYVELSKSDWKPVAYEPLQ